MKKHSLTVLAVVLAGALQACGWCCGCTSSNPDKLLLLLAGSTEGSSSIQYVAAEDVLEAQ